MSPPAAARDDGDRLCGTELQDAWPVLSRADRAEGFSLLPRGEAEDLFLALSSREQYHLLMTLPLEQRRSWVRMLPPDDTADLIQETPADARKALLELLDEPTRMEVNALLAYAEDEAGGLMNPRYARVRPDMTANEAVSYLRKQARARVETVYIAYVLDEQQKLVGVVSFRDLFSAEPDKRVRDVMQTNVVTVSDKADQEAVGRLFTQTGLAAIPVVDEEGRMKGIVTVDDIVEVVQ